MKYLFVLTFLLTQLLVFPLQAEMNYCTQIPEDEQAFFLEQGEFDGTNGTFYISMRIPEDETAIDRIIVNHGYFEANKISITSLEVVDPIVSQWTNPDATMRVHELELPPGSGLYGLISIRAGYYAISSSESVLTGTGDVQRIFLVHYQLKADQSLPALINLMPNSQDLIVISVPYNRLEDFYTIYPSLYLTDDCSVETFTINSTGTTENGIWTPMLRHAVSHGDTYTFTVTPNSGYTASAGGTCPLGSWSGDTYTTGSITEDCDVEFDFSSTSFQTYSLQIISLVGEGTITSSPAGIDCGSTCSADFAQDTIVTLTATPAPGATFLDWGGACTGTQHTCTVSLVADVSVSARFETQQVTTQPLSVVVNGPGSVTSLPEGIDCGNDCVADFPTGSSVILTANPQEGAMFQGWTGACSGNRTTCTLSASQARSVMAIFATIPVVENQSLSVSVTGPGSVTSAPTGILCGVDCQEDFPAGTQVTLTALPNPGARFLGWSGDCTGTNASCTLTVDRDHSVQAQFSTTATEALPLAINLVGEGRIQSNPVGIDCTGLCLGRFSEGTSLTLTATPAAGWIFAGWEGACTGTAAICTLEIDSPQAVTATFEAEAIAGQEPLNVIVVGLGTVTSDPSGIDCGADCENSFIQGTSVTLIATPATGNTFIGWGGACAASGTNPSCTLNMDQAQLAVAAFGGAVVRPETTAWKVAEIYMATLGYAPDNEGLQYWITNIDVLPQWTPETVAGSFFDQPLVQEIYPPEQGYGSFIDALYRNLFGRGADQQGYEYWLQQLENGQIARQHMIIAMINGGWDNPSPDALSDMQRFGYRIEVALAFADYQANNGIVYSQLSEANQAYLRQVGHDILVGVNTEEANRDAAIGSIPILLAPLVN
jgi:hypothetical protein